VQAVAGSPHLLAHEPGAIVSPISPDGSSFVSERPDGTRWLASFKPTDGRRLAIAAGEFPIEWNTDGSSLFIGKEGDARLTISRMELGSGRRFAVKDIAVSDPAGFTTFFGEFVTPDARTIVFSMGRVLGDVFIVEGLR